jgi:hypothetical protein
MRIERYRKTRYWAVLDTADTLVCLCVYRKGAQEVVKRLRQALDDAQLWQTSNVYAEEVTGRILDCNPL